MLSAVSKLARSIFGSSNDRRVRGLRPRVDQINALEPEMEALADADFPARTAEWKRQVEAGEATLDDLVVPAFALVREASRRALGMRPFDVQLIGAMILHEGSIAEMRTGEGKTLVATLAVYLNALSGKGVHVVTVNDYLARRAPSRAVAKAGTRMSSRVSPPSSRLRSTSVCERNSSSLMASYSGSSALMASTRARYLLTLRSFSEPNSFLARLPSLIIEMWT